MGSTVVLIFETPIDQPFEFTLEAGRRVTLGQKIGDFKCILTPPFPPPSSFSFPLFLLPSFVSKW
jgi:hypothetical protein